MPRIPSKTAQTRIDSGNVFAFPPTQSSVHQLEQLEAFLHFRLLWAEVIPPQALPWAGMYLWAKQIKQGRLCFVKGRMWRMQKKAETVQKKVRCQKTVKCREEGWRRRNT